MKTQIRHLFMLAGMILALNAPTFAQKSKKPSDIPNFGEVPISDVQLKSCPTDKNAEAEVLFDVAETDMMIAGGKLEIETRFRKRVKIYNEKGHSYADVKIPFLAMAGKETVSKIEALTCNLDASGKLLVTKMDPKAVMERKVDKQTRETVFSLPDVKSGSVIEYRYTVRRFDYFSIDDWAFQNDIPVRYSRVKYSIPEEFTFTVLPVVTLPMDVKDEKESGFTDRAYSMKDVPAMKDEPYMSSPRDFMQRISFKLIDFTSGSTYISFIRTWPKTIQMLMEDEDFGDQLKKNIKRTEDLDAELKGMASPYKRMEAVHHYVRKNMHWDGNYSIWAMEGVKSAWERKKGNSGEINMILVNLLKDAGLKAFPVLVSTHDHGRVNTGYPFYTQFNKVVALVRMDSSEYFLDATDQVTPSNMIPPDILYTEGLVIDALDFNKPATEQQWGWVVLFNGRQHYRQFISVVANLDKAGSISGEAFVSSIGYARINRMGLYNEQQEKFKENYFVKPYGNLKVEKLEVLNADKDSMPLDQKLNFSLPVQSSGDYSYFSLNLFTGLEKNPFLSEDRVSDIIYGYDQRYSLSASYTIPEGYAFEELPKNMRMIMPDTSVEYKRIMQADGNTLNVRITLNFNNPYVKAEDYPAFWQFYKKLFDILNEQIVIKKTKP
jgi:hypothetical protein